MKRKLALLLNRAHRASNRRTEGKRFAVPLLLFVMCLISAQLNGETYTADYQEENLRTTGSVGVQGDITVSGSLDRVLNTILKFFSSGYMRYIVSIALGGLGVGLIMNRGEPGIIKKFIPWIAGCIILLSLTAITNMMGFK